MELFQVNEALAALENALPLQHGDAWLEASVNLAWYLSATAACPDWPMRPTSG
jgi:hypothetical protein